MGWGTPFKVELYLNRMIFNNVIEIEDAIKESEDYIQSEKDKLLMFAAINIRDIIPEDRKNDPVDWLMYEVKNCFEQIDQEQYKVFLLKTYLDYVKDNNIDLTEQNTDEY